MDITPLSEDWLLDVVDANVQEQQYMKEQQEEDEDRMEQQSYRSISPQPIESRDGGVF